MASTRDRVFLWAAFFLRTLGGIGFGLIFFEVVAAAVAQKAHDWTNDWTSVIAGIVLTWGMILGGFVLTGRYQRKIGKRAPVEFDALLDVVAAGNNPVVDLVKSRLLASEQYRILSQTVPQATVPARRKTRL